jgi:ATP-dependent RNA helicase RhlE
MQFSQLGLCRPILLALEQEGYSVPTPIQQAAIGPALIGRDVLGCAQTGTGKTAAFALPLLHRLLNAAPEKAQRGPRRARALVLTPTRELASQIGEAIGKYGRHTGLEHVVVFGGVSQFHQARALARGVDVIVATPGRLIDLMEQGIAQLADIEVLVLDEADRMLDMGFIQPIRRIAGATRQAPARQTLLFSATMPAAITQLAKSLLRDPARIAVNAVSSTAPAIEQGVYMVNRPSKQPLLEHLLTDDRVSRALVFTRTKHGADRVGRRLSRAGVRAEIIHGDKAQPQRRRALERFSSGSARVLVATDVAARGLDVEGISHVFNFDLPVEPEAYVHRIGRTGRAGATGIALSFCDVEERNALRHIERITGKRIPVKPVPAVAAASLCTEERDQGVAQAIPPGNPSGRAYGRKPQRRPNGWRRY